ncbi:MAG: hypothetical protein ACJ72X_01335, partial [Nitrososphaeraceae archaeon]
TPNIATRDTGNGNSKEMIKTIPNNIPNNANWLTKNCCLLLLFEFNLYSQIPFVTMLILFDVHRSIKNLIDNVRLLGLAYSSSNNNSNSNTNNNSSNSSSDNNNQGVMRFTLLAPSASVQQQQQRIATSSDLVTNTGGIHAAVSWSPNPLKPKTQSTVNISFYDP